jgi:hypothetical protein
MRPFLLSATSFTCLLVASICTAQETTGSAPQQISDQRPLNPTQEIAGQQPEGNAIPIGPAQLRIGGYFGLTAVTRSTNSGGGTGTSFGSIPYEDTVRGNVSETRLSAQASRLSIRVDAAFPEDSARFQSLAGYFEMDFNGSTSGTVAVTSTSVGFRLRHAFAEVRYGQSFFLAAGQAFTLMTPPKDQLSIWPSDYEMSQAVDTNYLAGLVWGRIPQLRLTWRPSRQFNWAVSVENPEQQLGRGQVTLPSCCSDEIGAQYNTGSDELGVPNLMPDFVTRIAFNPNRTVHVDVGGVLRVFRHTIVPYEDTFKKVGGGVGLNLRVNATQSTRLIGQTAFGLGLGRYIGGLVPDVAFDSHGSINAIGTTSWVGGFEQSMSSNISVGGYFSGVKTDDVSAIDINGSYIGYGFPGSSNANNRSIKEVTGTASYMAVKAENRGSVQFNVQASWVTREPWFQGTGPSSADALMFFAQVRYNLP